MGKKGQGVDHRSPRLRQALEYVFTGGGVGEGELGEGRAPDSRARPALDNNWAWDVIRRHLRVEAPHENAKTGIDLTIKC